MAHDAIAATAPDEATAEGTLLQSIVIGLMAFLTVVDLFAAQAILPALATHYGVAPAAMGLAVNASTFGMAVAGLAVALASRWIPPRAGVVVALAVLAVPTALLAIAPDLTSFAALRVLQGLMMAVAFTLTLAYLGEHCSAAAATGAFAAYITGNVAANLVGRMISASVAGGFGLEANFAVFAVLNLAGAGLAFHVLRGMPAMSEGRSRGSALMAMLRHLRNPRLLRGFGIGFAILFVFIGTFTYVNFVLVGPPLSLRMAQVGLVYLVFLPSIVTTPVAGRAVARFGVRPTLLLSLALAGAGLPLLLLPELAWVLAGLVLVGAGTFFAQATATGYVSRAADSDRGAASGIYLGAYFLGGLVGAAVLGQIFDAFGWAACVGGIAAGLAGAMALAMGIRPPEPARIIPAPGRRP